MSAFASFRMMEIWCNATEEETVYIAEVGGKTLAEQPEKTMNNLAVNHNTR
jgi:hypothetical protein